MPAAVSDHTMACDCAKLIAEKSKEKQPTPSQRATTPDECDIDVPLQHITQTFNLTGKLIDEKPCPP
ncbi:hypothetical protein [Acidovorax cavernicola]|uniref:hypothetical protein n=1 Tax=Acidovorax cavernicola TaxID=1675792 RepID=UPI00142E5739|nr:hypothetical protein [Acidovorax cavernicola]